MYEVRFAEDEHWLDRGRYLVYRKIEGANFSQMLVLRPDGTEFVYELSPTVEVRLAPEDWFRIPLDALGALHGALAKKLRLDGIEDPRALRQDYDAERERVDTLMASLIRIADASVLR